MEDGRVVAPATVWAVELGSAEDETKGTLTLGTSSLSFHQATGTRGLDIPLATITRVKRMLGSPVLMVDHEHDGRHTRSAFFFAQPPPISQDPGTRKRREKRQNMGTLLHQSASKGGDLKRWRSELRAAVRRARAGAESRPPDDAR